MAEIDDRLVPRDGLNNYHSYLSRVELEPHGGAQFVFAVTHSMLAVAEFTVAIPAGVNGLDRMTLDAHDALIDILRQLIFRADKARGLYARHTAPPAPEAGAAERQERLASDEAPRQLPPPSPPKSPFEEMDEPFS